LDGDKEFNMTEQMSMELNARPIGRSILTHSRLDAFQRCRRYHHNAYGLGVRLIPSDDLYLGTVVHEAVAAIHAGRSAVDSLIDLLSAYAAQIEAAQTEERTATLAIEQVKAFRLIEGWSRRWSDSPIEIVATERHFEIPLLNPDTGAKSQTYTFAGKIDAIARLEDGRLAVYELKTMSDDLTIGSDYWKTKQLDPQIARYLIAARTISFDCATILYDAIRKPEIRPKQVPLVDADGFKIVMDLDGNRVFLDNGKPRQSGDESKGWKLQSRIETPDEYSTRLAADIAERPDFYFARMEVPRLDHELAEAAADMWDIAKDIRNAELHDRHYLNTRSCRLFGRCAYLDVCTNRTDLSTGSLPDGFYRIGNVHPELLENHHGSNNSPSVGEGSAATTSTASAASCGVEAAGDGTDR
jgi:hypothetical protein